jgi:hypothetical protein
MTEFLLMTERPPLAIRHTPQNFSASCKVPNLGKISDANPRTCVLHIHNIKYAMKRSRWLQKYRVAEWLEVPFNLVSIWPLVLRGDSCALRYTCNAARSRPGFHVWANLWWLMWMPQDSYMDVNMFLLPRGSKCTWRHLLQSSYRSVRGWHNHFLIPRRTWRKLMSDRFSAMPFLLVKTELIWPWSHMIMFCVWKID